MTSAQYQRIISTLAGLKQTYTDRRVRYLGRYDANGQLESNPASGLPVGYVWVNDGSARAVSRAKNVHTEYAAGLPVIVAYNTETQEDEVIGVDPVIAVQTHGSAAAALNSPRKGVGVPTPVSARDVTPGGLYADSAIGGLNVRVLSFWHSGGYWSDSPITLAPTSTSDRKSFVLVGIDPATNTAYTALSADQGVLYPMIDSAGQVLAVGDIQAVMTAAPSIHWIGAVELANGDTTINPSKIVDLRFWRAALPLKVTDGTTTITGASEIEFTSGATVTASGKTAQIAITTSGGGGMGDYLLFTHEESANVNGGTATSGSRQTRRLNYKRHDTGNNGSIIELAFTSGGTYTIAAGDTITGATSAATATVFDVVITSGSFAAGDAAGVLWLNGQSGTFQSENLNVGTNSNVATISGDSTSANYRFRLAAGTYRIGGKFQFYDTGGVKVWLYNVTDAADQAGVYGEDSYTPSSGSANVAIPLEGRFTLAASKTMCVQYRCGVTSTSTDGQGVRNNFGGNEIYALLRLDKE